MTTSSVDFAPPPESFSPVFSTDERIAARFPRANSMEMTTVDKPTTLSSSAGQSVATAPPTRRRGPSKLLLAAVGIGLGGFIGTLGFLRMRSTEESVATTPAAAPIVAPAPKQAPVPPPTLERERVAPAPPTPALERVAPAPPAAVVEPEPPPPIAAKPTKAKPTKTKPTKPTKPPVATKPPPTTTTPTKPKPKPPDLIETDL